MSMSLLLGWGAYARDKNTSARLCAKKAGGELMREGGRICGTLRYLQIIEIFSYKGKPLTAWADSSSLQRVWLVRVGTNCPSPRCPLFGGFTVTHVSFSFVSRPSSKEGLGTRLFCSYALVRECLGMRLHSTLTWIALLSSLVVGFFFPCCPPSAPPPLPRPLPSRWNGFSPFCGDLGVFSSETTAAFMEGGFPLATPAPCWWSWSFFEELIQDLRLRSHASIFNFRYNRKIFGNWWAWLKARISTWVELGAR